MSSRDRGFAVTICAYRKPGLGEAEYHKYISETHAVHLRDLLAKNKIISYTMQHNTSQTKAMTEKALGPDFSMMADCDAFVQIVFQDIQDYINVKEDPHYKNVVNPDHANFADATRTTMVIGWLEAHIADGRIV